jgi:signal transduction histidine kinase
MPRHQPKLRFNFLIRRGLPWLAVILYILFPVGGWAAEETSANTSAPLLSEATNHLGRWIWETNTMDKQTCRFWKPFDIPRDIKISRATVRITVDNGYTLFLDGREIGRGSDWRTVTEYDVTELLNPGRHVIAVEAFNDRLQAGLIFGLNIQLMDENRSTIDVVSDDTWRIVPNTQRGWLNWKTALPDWHHAIVVGSLGQPPWQPWPFGVSVEPPLRPIIMRFWQTGWFQLTLMAVCAVAVLFCLWLMTQLTAQGKAQRFLQIERARIARDIHDDLGARLTNLLLLGEVAQSELPADSGTRAQINEICEKARDLAHALDEVVWAVNSRRDTVRDFATYVCKYAQFFLGSTSIRCRLDVEPEIPPDRQNQQVMVVVEDNGRGFDPAQAEAVRNGMTNMTQRMSEIGGNFNLASQPGNGCRVEFAVPLGSSSYPRWLARYRSPAIEAESAPRGAAAAPTPAQS